MYTIFWLQYSKSGSVRERGSWKGGVYKITISPFFLWYHLKCSKKRVVRKSPLTMVLYFAIEQQHFEYSDPQLIYFLLQLVFLCYLFAVIWTQIYSQIHSNDSFLWNSLMCVVTNDFLIRRPFFVTIWSLL